MSNIEIIDETETHRLAIKALNGDKKALHDLIEKSLKDAQELTDYIIEQNKNVE